MNGKFVLAIFIVYVITFVYPRSYNYGRSGGYASINCDDFVMKFRLETARIPYRCINKSTLFGNEFSQRSSANSYKCNNPDGCFSAPRAQARSTCDSPVRGRCDQNGCCYQAEIARCFSCSKVLPADSKET